MVSPDIAIARVAGFIRQLAGRHGVSYQPTAIETHKRHHTNGQENSRHKPSMKPSSHSHACTGMDQPPGGRS